MDPWLKVFILAASVAIILQFGILLGMYLQFRQMNQQITRVSNDLNNRLEPILSRLGMILQDSHGKVANILGDAEEVARLARSQALKVDRVFTEAVDRLRDQILRADQILTGVLEFVEDTGADMKKTLLEPVRQAAAVIKGVQAGLELLRSHRRAPERTGARQEEELFI